VLIVEDERAVALALKDVLHQLGYDAFAIADSAEDALACALKRRPDIVIMDIGIKGPMDGVAAAQMLETRFGVPVVYLTGHDESAAIGHARTTEDYGYLLKPVKSAELRSALEVALTKHDLSDRLRVSEERFRHAFDNSPVGMTINLQSGRGLRINAAMCDMLGYSENDVIEAGVAELRRGDFDCLIGFGGGSPIDTAN